MISLDQVLLLEQKVESAVKKITQLQAENDALRSKCAELTNALSSKSEQLSSFEQDQNKIESGILQALNRLSSIENSVLQVAGGAQQQVSEPAKARPTVAVNFQSFTEPAAAQISKQAQSSEIHQNQIIIPASNSSYTENSFVNPAEGKSFSNMNQISSSEKAPDSFGATASENDAGQFDIF